MKNHETVLPHGYEEIKHINALDKKFGLIFNAVALIIAAVVMAIAAMPFYIGDAELTILTSESYITMAVLLFGLVAYIVLHELVHGIAYKLLTHEKLTFGFGWSCAFCGVPNIYVYRRASLIALVAPLITFTVLLVPLMIAMLHVSAAVYLSISIIFASHLGGCAGDIYMTLLLLFKYRECTLLVRDTGPEQYIYLKKDENTYERDEQ